MDLWGNLLRPDSSSFSEIISGFPAVAFSTRSLCDLLPVSLLRVTINNSSELLQKSPWQLPLCSEFILCHSCSSLLKASCHLRSPSCSPLFPRKLHGCLHGLTPIFLHCPCSLCSLMLASTSGTLHFPILSAPTHLPVYLIDKLMSNLFVSVSPHLKSRESLMI